MARIILLILPAAVFVVTAGAMFALNWLAHWVGWQICLGFGLGGAYVYCTFRLHYGWWPDFNCDGEDDVNRTLPRL